MSGKAGCSGRKRDPTKEVKRMLDKISSDKLPNILWMMATKAEAGDKDFAMYLSDRILGRPHQSIDNRVSGKVEMDWGALKCVVIQSMQQVQDSIKGEVIEGEIKQIGTRD